MKKKTIDGRKLKHEVLTELRKRAVARVSIEYDQRSEPARPNAIYD